MNRPYMFRVVANGKCVQLFRTLDRALEYIHEESSSLLFSENIKFQIYNEFTKDYLDPHGR